MNALKMFSPYDTAATTSVSLIMMPIMTFSMTIKVVFSGLKQPPQLACNTSTYAQLPYMKLFKLMKLLFTTSKGNGTVTTSSPKN
jgi:hypothetical protein